MVTELRFTIEPPKRKGWFSQLVYGLIFFSGTISEPPYHIVGRNSDGQKVLYIRADTSEEAQRKLERIRAEFETMPVADFCERYGIDPALLDPDTASD